MSVFTHKKVNGYHRNAERVSSGISTQVIDKLFKELVIFTARAA